MSTVVFDISMSLDGFVTAANRTKEEPMGDGGQVLHAWARGQDDANREYLEGAIAGLGAVIAGRDTYDTSMPWWGADGPSGSARRPVFVVTHAAPADSPEGGVYTFVTDGIDSALRQAKAAAGALSQVWGGCGRSESIRNVRNGYKPPHQPRLSQGSHQPRILWACAANPPRHPPRLPATDRIAAAIGGVLAIAAS